MNNIASSLNYLLAANYTELGRASAPAAAHPAAKAPADLRASLGPLKPGTQVTARYEYTVDPLGKLVAGNASVTALSPEEQGKNGFAAFTAADERPKRFSDFQKPRPTLEPADEALLFASDPFAASSVPAGIAIGGAQDEQGQAIEVEIIAPRDPNRPVLSAAAQQQQKISDLYARNHALAYGSDPVLAFAA